jgi:hypothetical protein
MTARSDAQGHAVTIRDEVAAGANTATRVGTNLKELADNALFTEDAGVTGSMAAVSGTANAAGSGTTYAPIDHAHFHGAQTVDTLHALASASAHGFEDKADKAFRDRLFTNGCRSAIVEDDDFVCGGLASSGAATIASAGGNTSFGKLAWRAATLNAASAVAFVTTAQDSTHRGVLSLDTGTNAAGAAGISRGAAGPTPTDIFGADQLWVQEWVVRIPNLSDGTNTYALRGGWIKELTVITTDGLYFEYSSAAPSSGNWIGRAAKASAYVSATGGPGPAVAANTWYRLTITWDGTTATFYVDGVSIGTIASGDMPTAAVAPGAHIIKSASTTARTALFDYCWSKYEWTTPRAA